MAVIGELTKLATDLAGLFQALGQLSSAVAAVVSPWLAPVVAAIGTWYARRALIKTNEGNVVAAQAVVAATVAADKADSARTEIQATLQDHQATQAFIVEKAEKGLEREQFEKAIAIGEAKARSDFGGLTQPGDLKP